MSTREPVGDEGQSRRRGGSPLVTARGRVAGATDPGHAAAPPVRTGPGVIVIEADRCAADGLCDRLVAAGAVVMGRGAEAREGVELARINSPDVALVDWALAYSDGVAVIEDLIALGLGIRPVLMATTWDVEDAVAAIRSGALGFMSKADLLELDLRRVLRAAMADQLVCSRGTAAAILDRLVTSPFVGAGFRPVRSPLTGREWEVLDLLSGGQSTEGIAGALGIAVETVRSHLKNMMRKLGARSLAEMRAAVPGLRGTPPVGL